MRRWSLAFHRWPVADFGSDGPNGPYFVIPFGIIIGLALPVIPWVLYKRYRWEWLKLINMSVMACQYLSHASSVTVLTDCLLTTPDNIGDLAGGSNGYVNTIMVLGMTSHFYLRKYRAGWFVKYNVWLSSPPQYFHITNSTAMQYLFGAAVDGGAQIFVFIFSVGAVSIPNDASLTMLVCSLLLREPEV